ncbi:MAG: hypothetical protein LQ347_005574 [Umbilicaria vellea]|nr:MAG: hypothetical protein LQ347_005574 [Umbilicaria vellea]
MKQINFMNMSEEDTDTNESALEKISMSISEKDVNVKCQKKMLNSDLKLMKNKIT